MHSRVGGAGSNSLGGLNNGLESASAAAAIMAGQGNGIYLNDLSSLAGVVSSEVTNSPQPLPPLPPVLDMDGLAAASGCTLTGGGAPMHCNNNNNMVSAGPSPSSSISDHIPHTSVALAAAAAAAVSSMASIEAMGFIDHHQQMTVSSSASVATHKMPMSDKEAAAAANGDGSSPKYISL